ncbi:hypothetical protein BGZ60DRAFT_517299 [Tricladium varicosporioides]|nr:hypothetical protein BGZ60DRAFT_517299 [Hymenoscyphus varicosporioides]
MSLLTTISNLQLPPLGVILYFLPLPISLLSLWSPPFKFRRPLSILAILIPLFAAQHYPFTDDTNQRFSLFMAWYIYLGVVAKFLPSSPPEMRYWRKGHVREEALLMDTKSSFSIEKLRWAIGLLCSQRGVGWNFQTKGTPSIPSSLRHQTRAQFLLQSLKDSMVAFVVLDLFGWYICAMHFSGPIRGEMTMWNLKGWERLVVVGMLGVQSRFANEIMYSWVSGAGVLLGSDPSEWPPFFGSLTESTTLRYFWGGFWHQGIRYILQSFTYGLMSFLHIPRHTALSSLLSLFLPFTFSGLYHGWASYVLAYPTPNSLHATNFDRFWRFFIWFELQAIGILIEDLAIRFWHSSFLAVYFPHYPLQTMARVKGHHPKGDKPEAVDGKSKWWHKYIGYLWVILWVLGTGHLLIDLYLKTEMGMLGMMPSYSEGIWRWVVRNWRLNGGKGRWWGIEMTRGVEWWKRVEQMMETWKGIFRWIGQWRDEGGAFEEMI